MRKKNTAEGYVCKSTMKLKASPAGGAKIMSTVMAHLSRYGPSGVPKGRVDTQNGVQGSTPCRPISRITRDCPMSTASRFPKALMTTRKLRPRAARVPKMALKKSEATVCSELRIASAGT